MLVGMFMGIFLDYRYINLKQVNILPIAQRKARYVLALMIPLFTVVLYCFDLSTLQVNVFFQLIMLLFEAFAVIHLGDMEARYKELTKYYELTNYIANERKISQDCFITMCFKTLEVPKISCRFAHQMLMKQKDIV